MTKDALQHVFKEIENGNNLGEPIFLVGAVKTMDIQTIQEAINCGLTIVGDNHVQEFREKSPYLSGAEFHFIGHLQTNKVKYLIGKVSLIQSVDSIRLAKEISEQSKKRDLTTDVLLEINIGGESSKSGFSPDSATEAVRLVSAMPNIRPLGLMAMLPKTTNQEKLSALCLQMRAIYDTIKKEGFPFRFLSVGMSEDYSIAIKNGSNMIRLGRAIFGNRTEQR